MARSKTLVITGVFPSSRVTQLNDSMTGPLSTLEEVEQRTGVYLARAEHLISKTHYFDAQRHLYHGYIYLYRTCIYRPEFVSGDVQNRRLFTLAAHFLARRGFCNYKLEDYRLAYASASHSHRAKMGQHLPTMEKATVAFYLGLAYVKESKLNLAVLALTKALHLQPGYIEADKELDILEDKSKSMAYSEDRHKAIHNITLSDGIFRHKQPEHLESCEELAEGFFKTFMFRLSREDQTKPPDNEDSADIKFLRSLKAGSDDV